MHVEQVDKELDLLEAGTSQEAGTNATAAQIKLFNICDAYKKLRPVLKFVRGLLFWKPRWQEVIDNALTSLDQACES